MKFYEKDRDFIHILMEEIILPRLRRGEVEPETCALLALALLSDWAKHTKLPLEIQERILQNIPVLALKDLHGQIKALSH